MRLNLKNKIIILILIVIVIICGIICVSKNKKENNVKNSISYKNEDNRYVIYNTVSNELITTVNNEIDVKIYQDNPDYNPNP